MSATLDYELKKCLGTMVEDNRWTVLTVLILHANLRNRCYVSMDTISRLATGGNRHKSTRAKKWLETHKAFELVPAKKRVDDEINVPPRQHVYQLTGLLKQCSDTKCACRKWGETTLHYLHQTPVIDVSIDTIKRVPIDTIEKAEALPNRAPVDTFNRVPIENINGYTVSIPSISKEQSREVGVDPAFQERGLYYSAFEMAFPPEARLKVRDIDKNKRTAQFLYANGYQPYEVNELVREKIASGRNDYRFDYLEQDMASKRLESIKRARPAPPEVVNGNARPVALETNWKREAADE